MLDISNKRYQYKSILYALSLLLILSFCLVTIELYASNNLNKILELRRGDQLRHDLADDTLSDLESAETGQRGYLLTGDINYLKSYVVAQSHIRTDLQTLKNLRNSFYNPSAIDKLIYLIGNKQDELKHTIDLYDQSGIEPALNVVRTNVGKSTMDQIQNIINGIQTRQDNILTKYEHQRTEFQRTTSIIAPLILASNTFLALVTLYMINKTIKKERQIESLQEDFVTIASHQLRTPATAIKQYLSLMLEGIYGKLPKKQKEVLTIVNDANNKEIDIVNSLLNISKLETSKLHMQKQPVDIVALLKIVAAHYGATLKSNKQKLVTEFPNGPVTLTLDRAYMMLAFENLLDNACKYTPPGKNIRLSVTETRDSYKIAFHDEGIGIRHRDIPKLYKKFSRLDNAAVTDVSGSGVGLYMVKHIVQLHGGTIRVRSKLHSGTTFMITLKKERS